MRKKVLIITYYWPPAGGPGVQRWLKFVKYLPEYNIEPIVFVPEDAKYPIIDESLQKDVLPNLHLVKFPISEPYKLARVISQRKTKTISKGIISDGKNQSLIEKLLLFIRGNFFIPDARVGWVKPASKFLNTFILEHNIKTVITSGPPHSLHLIGLKLKQQLDIKWLADFRDPWTTIGYHKHLKLTHFAKQKHKHLEKKALNMADHIIVTSPSTKLEFSRISTKPITVITNGYDDEQTDNIALDSGFTISHIGSFLSKRNPENLWKALSELILEHEDFAKDFQLNLVGYTSKNVLENIKKYGLSNYVNNIGYINHNESVRIQKKSQILLLVEINSVETVSIIPGKLFEYIVANRPILAIGPKASDIEQIIKETNTGAYLEYEQFNIIKKTILHFYQLFKLKKLVIQPMAIHKYHRKYLTKSLSKLI